MIKLEQEVKNTLKIKGILVNCDDSGCVVEDEKDGTQDTFDLSIFKKFLNKSFSLTMAEKEVKAIEDDKTDEDE